MRGRELYGRYHQLINAIAQSAEPGVDWWAELKACIERFEADAGDLSPLSAQWLREELCTQFEHEAFQSSDFQRRAVLLAAVKRLELNREDSCFPGQE